MPPRFATEHVNKDAEADDGQDEFSNGETQFRHTLDQTFSDAMKGTTGQVDN